MTEPRKLAKLKELQERLSGDDADLVAWAVRVIERVGFFVETEAKERADAARDNAEAIEQTAQMISDVMDGP